MPTEEEMERAFEGLSMNFNRGQYLTTIMFIQVTCVGVLVIDLYWMGLEHSVVREIVEIVLVAKMITLELQRYVTC